MVHPITEPEAERRIGAPVSDPARCESHGTKPIGSETGAPIPSLRLESRLDFPPPRIAKSLMPTATRIGAALGAAMLAMLTSHLDAAADDSPAEKLLNAPRPLVIGHRGYCEIAPENTLPSFKLAKTAGADLVELDYYPTKDGELIVIHDATLDRTTDA